MPITVICQTLFHVLGTGEWPQEQTHKKQSPLLTGLHAPRVPPQERALRGLGSSPQKAGSRNRIVCSSKTALLLDKTPQRCLWRNGPCQRKSKQSPSVPPSGTTHSDSLKHRCTGAHADWSFGFSPRNMGHRFFQLKSVTQVDSSFSMIIWTNGKLSIQLKSAI